MSRQFQFSNLWQGMSTELLDTTLRVRPFRNWALSRGQRQLYRKYVLENQDRLPRKVQEMRCKVLTNLLHSVNRAFSDGRISSQVRHSIIKDFIGSLVIGE